MGTREDVIVAITKKGWEYMMECLSNLIDNGGDKEANDVMNLINDSDEHWINPDEDHMISWECIKSSADDFSDFRNLLSEMDDKSMEDEYFMLILNEDGTDESIGGWNQNPFDMGVHRSLNYNSGGCELQNHCAGPKKSAADSSKRYWPVTIPATSTPVNDHTCTQCGNSSCSKSEKSCWKCGCPIS